MAALGAIAIVAFLLFVISRHILQRRTDPKSDETIRTEPHWFVLILAGLVLLVGSLLLIWILIPSGTIGPWSTDTKGGVFLIVMIIVAVLALIAFGVGLVVFHFRREAETNTARTPRTGEPSPSQDTDPAPVVHRSPIGIRILGLLAILAAILIMGWTALSADQQHTIIVNLVYPASFAVAIVLLMDKASRALSEKPTAAVFREWLFCDGLLVLLILAFINLFRLPDPQQYSGLFWDLLGLLGFFVVFWAIDRSRSRFRFLLAYLYILLLPVLMWIWQAVHAVEDADEADTAAIVISWWDTAWPVFFLTIIFGVLEIIALVAARGDDKHGIPAAKDTIYVLLYAILLLIAIP